MSLVLVGAVILLAVGTSLAWTPAFRLDPMVIPARLFLAISAIAILADPRGVGLVLGGGLAVLAALLWWRTQPPPAVPRPRLLGIGVATLLTTLAVIATNNGWAALGRIPESASSAAALVAGAIGSLGTLAVADRSRVQLRDAIRRRFRPVDPNPLPALLSDMRRTEPLEQGNLSLGGSSGLDAAEPPPQEEDTSDAAEAPADDSTSPDGTKDDATPGGEPGDTTGNTTGNTTGENGRETTKSSSKPANGDSSDTKPANSSAADKPKKSPAKRSSTKRTPAKTPSASGQTTSKSARLKQESPASRES